MGRHTSSGSSFSTRSNNNWAGAQEFKRAASQAPCRLGRPIQLRSEAKVQVRVHSAANRRRLSFHSLHLRSHLRSNHNNQVKATEREHSREQGQCYSGDRMRAAPAICQP
jgi:hypothetical protein